MFLGALVIAAFIMVVPGGVADGIAAVRAAWTNDQKYLREDQARRRARTQRIADAWSHRRAARSLNAGGDGTYRPGAWAYLRDIYHGFFEARLEKSQAKRGTVNDDSALARKVEQLRSERDASLHDEPHVDVPDTARPDPEPEPQRPPEPEAPVAQVIPLRPLTPYRPHQITPEPQRPAEAAPTEGVPAVTTAEVMNNEGARANFAEMQAGAAQLAEAASLAEAARSRIAAAAAANADAMSGMAFDSGATAAAADISDIVSDATLTAWCGKADEVGGIAAAGISHLDKYLDAEDVVASNGVDTRTLATF